MPALFQFFKLALLVALVPLAAADLLCGTNSANINIHCTPNSGIAGTAFTLASADIIKACNDAHLPSNKYIVGCADVGSNSPLNAGTWTVHAGAVAVSISGFCGTNRWIACGASAADWTCGCP